MEFKNILKKGVNGSNHVLSMIKFLLDSQSFCQKSAERKSPEKYFLYFVLMSGLGFEPGFSSNKPTHNLLDHGDFEHTYIHTYILAMIKMSFIWKYDFFFCKIGIFCKSIAGQLPSVVQEYTQPYSSGGRIKLIICQIRHELSATIHEISTSWKKTLDGGPYFFFFLQLQKYIKNCQL